MPQASPIRLGRRADPSSAPPTNVRPGGRSRTNGSLERVPTTRRLKSVGTETDGDHQPFPVEGSAPRPALNEGRGSRPGNSSTSVPLQHRLMGLQASWASSGLINPFSPKSRRCPQRDSNETRAGPGPAGRRLPVLGPSCSKPCGGDLSRSSSTASAPHSERELAPITHVFSRCGWLTLGRASKYQETRSGDRGGGHHG